MKQVKLSIYFFVLIPVLFLMSCNQSTTTTAGKNDMDSTSTVIYKDTSSAFVYDPAMDPWLKKS